MVSIMHLLSIVKSFISICLSKMKMKDLVIGFGSFILGCVVTLNFISLGFNEKSANFNDSEHLLREKSAKDIKLFSAINYFLIIIIISGADNLDQRTAIRESWGLFIKDFADVQYFFIIGSSGLPSKKIAKLRNEQIKYNDLFLLSVPDSYMTLASKVLEALSWFDKEFNFKYILKCDDDSFVLIPKLVSELQNNIQKYDHLYWGYFNGRAHVKQSGKWKEKSWFLCDRYLPYALGGGYVISHSLVHYLRTNKEMLSTYVSEDVSVGVWLSPLNITRLHDVRFDTEYMSRGCNNSYLVTHKQGAQALRTLYASYIHTGQLCAKETRLRKVYEYKWNVLPVQCCSTDDNAVHTNAL